MPLKAVVEKLDDVPEPFRPLYAERDGKFEITGIEGIKTQADVDRLNEALRKEKNDHKQAREKAALWGDLKHDEVMQKLDLLPELEARAAAGQDPKKIDELLEARLKGRLAPIERERDKYKTEWEKANGTIAEMTGKERTRTIHDAIRKAAAPAKLINEALDDVLMLAERVFEVTEQGAVLVKDAVGATPGLDPTAWLAEMQPKRPHWWPPSQGGGSGGGGGGGGAFGDNPWAADTWNMTKQGAVVREKGMVEAERMAKAAGSRVGATAPTKKK